MRLQRDPESGELFPGNLDTTEHKLFWLLKKYGPGCRLFDCDGLHHNLTLMELRTCGCGRLSFITAEPEWPQFHVDAIHLLSWSEPHE